MKRTPLARKTPLARGRPLKAGAPMKRSKPMAKKRPKRKNAERSEEYLDFVRSQPCMVTEDRCACKGLVEAHHFGRKGMSQKVSDRHVVPLCAHHHRGCWHDRGGIPGASRSEWLARFRTKAAELLLAYGGEW